jgi:tetratricopeptide (TPR) repeat protein
MPSEKNRPIEVRDLTIVGDFLKYLLVFFIPFFIIGLIYGLIYECYLMCILANPLIYAAGLSLIIIVIRNDVNDIMALIGRAREPQLAMHIKHHTAIQKVSLELSMKDYRNALNTVNELLAREPQYPSALNLKGQILLHGFRNYEEALECFDKVRKLTRPDSADYKLADELRDGCLTD